MTELDEQVRRTDPDRWLSSRYIADPERRSDVIALYALDHELGRAGRVTSNPLLAEVRLTWWGEVLDEIYERRTVRKHPTALALDLAIRRRALPREPLEAAVDAWFEDRSPDAAGAVAAVVALVLDPEADREAARLAGRAWRTGVDDLARAASRRLSAEAFPAVAHAVLHGALQGELRRRLRLTWAVARGSI